MECKPPDMRFYDELKDLKNKTQEQVPRADAANRVRALLSD